MPKKIIKKSNKTIDVRSNDGDGWLYSDIVKDHFFSPRNFMRYEEEKTFKFNAVGRVGSPACGDEMVLWLIIDTKTEKIKDCRWRTFGCGSAIASTSILSEMIKEKGGMNISQALKITPQDIMERLGGLPDRKIHCSVLGDKALQAAINDYFRKTGQHDKIITAGAKVIDTKLNITDHDIEEAVLEGAETLEDLQKKLKVGISDEKVKIAVEELLHFYKEKYFNKS
ncbi:MAG: iron-sulfur cluster assembly scaffold protein [Candidatus Magasanikbacteria bacterium CG10_big_fil_rev_8_21_14_0_10_36_32]|uniref:Iron-sulfur cluster assembly scaffold protein n=1 Tax=Candidatus Magasanikbacteria bacterium CG10_big_fil_rev_8_21_14_0_10_36_32 TaxID=1974646 RepID=A0A2M6W7P7_9BACT|nr:MAG: iron-sulfur cluster assembly scaffold protein [Candidatus Magasanikbacteria bacterium CG10_big_fil_rev_8_21_14_0_10_36_32]